MFMSTIDIYDISRDKWYKQPTIGGPGQLTQGCAVVAVAQDYSSYNIYYYGGYDGIHIDGDYNDDVWILSLPSFMWMKVYSGDAQHGRAGHKCVTPYPDQMVVVGGAATAQTGTNCVEDGIMLNFNLTEGKWLEAYDPSTWSNYGVPQMIHVMIGGDFTGGATMTTPTPTGWADDELAAVFATPYETSKLKSYYPYAPDSDTDPNRVDTGSGGNLPSWVPPVLGVVLGLVFITAIVVAVLLYRRRRLLKGGGIGHSSHPDEQGNRIISWIRGQSGSDKAPTVTTDDTPPPHIDDMESRVNGASIRKPEMAHYRAEMPDTPLVELMGKFAMVHRPAFVSVSLLLPKPPFESLDYETTTNVYPLPQTHRRPWNWATRP